MANWPVLPPGGDAALEKCLELGRIVGLAFPDRNDSPPEATKLPDDAPIACRVLFELSFPKVRPRFRGIGLATSPVPMPETAMHKNHNGVTL